MFFSGAFEIWAGSIGVPSLKLAKSDSFSGVGTKIKAKYSVQVPH